MPAKTLPTQKSLESDLWIEIEEHAQTGKGPLNIWLAKWAHEKIQEACDLAYKQANSDYDLGYLDGYRAGSANADEDAYTEYEDGYDAGYEAGYEAGREESTLDKLTK